MSQTPSVLIVESSAEEREVLRTVLERRGLRIFEADEAQAGLALARQHRPDVIVLDTQTPSAAGDEWQAELDAATDGSQPSLIILGKARRNSPLPAGQVIAQAVSLCPARAEDRATGSPGGLAAVDCVLSKVRQQRSLLTRRGSPDTYPLWRNFGIFSS